MRLTPLFERDFYLGLSFKYSLFSFFVRLPKISPKNEKPPYQSADHMGLGGLNEIRDHEPNKIGEPVESKLRFGL